MRRLALCACASIALATQSGRATAQVFIGQNFTGSGRSEGLADPPDTMGAVGPNHFVEFINDRFGVYAKTGGPRLFTSTDLQFWAAALPAGVTPNGTLTTPRIIYDPSSQRWFASALDGASGGVSNSFLVAVSNSADPTAGWHAFQLPADPLYWSDDATLGINADGLFLAANAYTTVGSLLSGATIVSIPKADLLAASPTVANRTTFLRSPSSDVGYLPQLAISFGPSTGREPLLAVDNESYGVLDRTSVLTPQAQPASLSASVDIPVSTTAAPPRARQPGAPGLDANDDRMDSAVCQVGGYLYAVHTIGLVPPGAPLGTAKRDAIRWYKIDEATNAPPPAGFSGTISATVDDLDHDYFEPSIAANAYGDVVIGFNRSGTGEYASSYAAIGKANQDGALTFGAPMLLTAGVGTVVHGIGNPWGVYSATNVDPADPFIFWTIQQWASGSNNWSTQISEIIIPRPGDVRWQGAAGGAFAATGNWYGAALPGVDDHAVFSVASTYTVSFAASATNKRLSARQGSVTLNLAGNTYSLTDTSASAPSVVVGEFGGTPRVILSGGGTLSSVNAFVGPNTGSDGGVTVGGGSTWTSSGSVDVGGSDIASGGTGTINVNATGSFAVAGTLRIWNGSSAVTISGGALNAGAAINDGLLQINSGSGVIGDLSGNGSTFLSAGVLTANRLRQNSLSINGSATVGLNAGGAPGQASKVESLSLSPSARLNINDSQLIIGTGVLSEVRALILSGRNGGTWDGNGIFSGSVVAGRNGLGYAAGNDPNLASSLAGQLGGETYGGGSVLVKYTFLGDADLDGAVGPNDLSILLNNYNGGGDWTKADFNYDGSVGFADLGLLLNNYNNSGLSAALDPQAIGLLAAHGFTLDIPVVVPEPTSLLWLLCPIIGLRRMRR